MFGVKNKKMTKNSIKQTFLVSEQESQVSGNIASATLGTQALGAVNNNKKTKMKAKVRRKMCRELCGQKKHSSKERKEQKRRRKSKMLASVSKSPSSNVVIVKNSPFAKVRVIPGKGYVTFEDYVKVHQQPSMPKPQLEEQSLPVETATSNKGWLKWWHIGLGAAAFIGGAVWLCANCQRGRTELLTLEVAGVLPLNNN